MRRCAVSADTGRNYALNPWNATEVLKEALRGLGDAYAYFVTHELESRRLRRHLRSKVGPLLVSVGSGRTVPDGWIGFDRKSGEGVWGIDLRRPLPLKDDSVDGILSEHMLEHFYLNDIEVMLTDWFRVLKPGGRVRIACPDARTVGNILLDTNVSIVAQQRELESRVHKWDTADGLFECRMANRLSHQFGEHVALLTPAWTKRLLENAGFHSIKEMHVTESAYFDGTPTTHFTKFPRTEFEVFCLEAVKSSESD